jgi:acyl carrier protein
VNRTDALTVALEVLRRIAPEVDVDQLDPSVDLRDQIDLDSMDVLDFVEGLHDATGISVPERDYPRVITLVGWAEYAADRAAG